MTSCPKPAIPDAPNRPPWEVAYAHFEGASVCMIDVRVLAQHCTCVPKPTGFKKSKRFRVASGIPHGRNDHHDPACVLSDWIEGRLKLAKQTNNCAEALAVFAARRDRLAEESQDDVPV